MRFRVDAPDGVTATPAEGKVVDGAQEITLSSAAGADQGYHDVEVAVTSGDTSYVQPVPLTVAAPGTLLAAYNNTGLSDDAGDHDEADFDGGGWSYSRQALAGAGLTPGRQGTVGGGLGFTWPDSTSGRPDNVSAAGQVIELADSASQLSFLGSGVNGNQQSRATVTYTDGSADTIDLALTDWTVGGGAGTVQYGNEIVARAAYRNVAGADRDPVDTYVFATRPFSAPAGKTIARVTLPEDGDLHVFTVAVR